MRNGTQLALTILAVALSVGAYILVTLGKTGKTPADVGVFIAIVGLTYLAVHLLTTRLAPGADPALLPTAALLAGVGYAVIYRLDPGRASDQFVWLMLGLFLFVLTLTVIRDHRSLDAVVHLAPVLRILRVAGPLFPHADAAGESDAAVDHEIRRVLQPPPSFGPRLQEPAPGLQLALSIRLRSAEPQEVEELVQLYILSQISLKFPDQF